MPSHYHPKSSSLPALAASQAVQCQVEAPWNTHIGLDIQRLASTRRYVIKNYVSVSAYCLTQIYDFH